MTTTRQHMNRFSLRVDPETAGLLQRARRAASSLWGRKVSTADITAYCWAEAEGEPFVSGVVGEAAFTYVRAGVPTGSPPDTIRLRSALRWALPELVRNLEMPEEMTASSVL